MSLPVSLIGEARSVRHSKLSVIAVYGAAMGCIGTGMEPNKSAIDKELMVHTKLTRSRGVEGDSTVAVGGSRDRVIEWLAILPSAHSPVATLRHFVSGVSL